MTISHSARTGSAAGRIATTLFATFLCLAVHSAAHAAGCLTGGGGGLSPEKAAKEYFPDFDLTRIDLRLGVPWFTSSGTRGITFGNRIYVDNDRDIGLVGHEITHSTQYAAEGWITFFSKYVTSYLGGLFKGMSSDDAYLAIPYEKAANEMEERIKADHPASGANNGCR